MNPPIAQVRGLIDAVEAFVDVDELPSKAVQSKALRLLDEARAERIPGNYHLYTVEGDTGEYDVALKGERRPDTGFTITSARCPCEAGFNGITCAHVLTALALAREAGHAIALDPA